ncbi:hypothetical protein JCM19236_3977 [Vibrio sp. JCM 19236]|nr:hypothetical protein JCM19236_3977 [Vibrio sp. JCM 19236]
MDLVQEVFRFEGWDEPKLVRLNLAKVKLEQEDEIILVELSESDDVVKDAKRLPASYPPVKVLSL